ncbi:MAG: endolytic transglycosylase MltG [Gammaproteobacteria bacterium]
MVRLLSLLFVLSLVASAFWLWRDMQQSLSKPLAIGQRGFDYEIKPGLSARDLAQQLARKKVIDSPWFLELEARRRGVATQIKAGEYHFDAGTTAAELLHKVVSGKFIQHSVTFVEGWTFKQLLAGLDAANALTHTLNNKSPPEVMRRIGQAGVHPEGRFFPDTYLFSRGTSDVEILRRAFDAMQRKMEQAWAFRDQGLPYKAPFDALIMASLIEKEAAKREERPIIAGVFLRRLKENMKLETDPTIIYAMGDRFDGNLSREHLGMDSPYNTYRYPGLTPTPIAMPGAASIEAALHPAPGDAMFFVAKGDGTHYFSSSLEEHNAAVARYQLKREVTVSDGEP